MPVFLYKPKNSKSPMTVKSYKVPLFISDDDSIKLSMDELSFIQEAL